MLVVVGVVVVVSEVVGVAVVSVVGVVSVVAVVVVGVAASGIVTDTAATTGEERGAPVASTSWTEKTCTPGDRLSQVKLVAVLATAAEADIDCMVTTGEVAGVVVVFVIPVAVGSSSR